MPLTTATRLVRIADGWAIEPTPAILQGYDAVTGRTGAMADLDIMDLADAQQVALEAAARLTHRFLMTA